jgi:acetyltransferase-like isoleucine patch superfamily enzyme
MIRRLLSRLVDALLSSRINSAVERALLHKYHVFGPRDRLVIHPTATVQNALFNTVSGRIEIEEDVFFGHSVSVLTGTHDVNAIGRQRESYPEMGRDITIRRGAWIASNATILGPCVIGENSVVGACSLVRTNVLPGTFVAGIPANVIRRVNGEGISAHVAI